MFNVMMYTDGSSRHHHKHPLNSAGVGVVLICKNLYKEISKHIGRATHNAAELEAVHTGLKALKNPANTSVMVYSDSTYVIGVLTNAYRAKVNIYLINKIMELKCQFAKVDFIHVRGHNGDKHNERADKLARLASKQGR